jgi:hypothetical protein
MDDIEEKLQSLLGDPNMMQKIMNVAQSFSQSQEQPQEVLPDIDLGLLQKVTGLAQQGSIDKNQQALLHALHPYLSRDRLNKLEKAMRAAKMARIATSLLGTSR